MVWVISHVIVSEFLDVARSQHAAMVSHRDQICTSFIFSRLQVVCPDSWSCRALSRPHVHHIGKAGPI